MTGSTSIVRIAQLSDTHFLSPGEPPEGGFAYDTNEAFAAVHTHLEAAPKFDLVVVTGDVADHGRADQYRHAAAAFSQFTAPVNVCPGNHDQDVAFAAGMGRPGVGTSRVIEAGSWCFVFVDSNSGVMIPDASGRAVDPADYDERLHGNGCLGDREANWIRDVCEATSAEHVFIWLHHPPAPPVGLISNDAYEAEWTELIADLPKVRGFGGGHTHVPDQYTFAGRPVFVCPALKNNFDLQAKTLLPPGYRSYEFHADGTITGEHQLVDDPQWPRHPLGRAVMSLLNGEISYQEFDAIVARKTATTS